MPRLVLLGLLVLILSALALAQSGIPMSPCIFGRATSGYSAPPDGGNVGGTCGLGPAQPYLPTWYSQRYVAAPDDETYNGYPWLSAPITIQTGGVGKSCGECFELTGDVGTIRIMVVDVCDTGCCSNCQGSLGGDLPDFDVDAAVLAQLTTGSGNVPIAYRKVSCDMGGRTVGLIFDTNAQAGYIRLRIYGGVVGIQSVEVKGSAGGGTGGNWTPLVRGWTGYFEWSGKGDIGAPWNIRVTNILNETITFPNAISPPYPADSHINSGLQFANPAPGYGGASGSCAWPGPDPEIYVDRLGGPPLLEWRDWGSYTSGAVDYNEGTGCVSGKCIRIAPSNAFGAMQIGTVVGAPLSYWDNLTFWIRCDSPVNVDVFWTGSSHVQISVTTSWTYHSIPNSLFFPSGSGTMRVVQFQLTQRSTGNMYIDEIVLQGANFARVVPIIGALDGPPPVGFPGYTGPDPYGGVPYGGGGGGGASVLSIAYGSLIACALVYLV